MKKKVAFICVHNSCRSQIAEALGKHLAGDVFESYSAGTEIKPQMNQDAVRLMKEIYGIDMEENGQRSKLISEIPEVDMAISMGCNVGCPFIGKAFDDNWGLEDPTGKSDEEFKIVISQIEHKICELKRSFIGEGRNDDKKEKSVMVEIKKCDNYDEARTLFIEYSKLKGAEVCFVSFENELKKLEEVYSSGVILLAKEDDKLIGCIAVKKIEEGTCELKRLFVREQYRGNGYSKQLFEKAISCATILGYKKAVIDTIPEVMPVGYKMYLRYGFVENSVDEKGIANLSMDL